MQRPRNTPPSPVSETLLCRSLQQADAQPVFEAQYAFAHHRPRQTDAFRRRGKALCLGDVNKGVNVPHSFDCHCLTHLGTGQSGRRVLRMSAAHRDQAVLVRSVDDDTLRRFRLRL